MEKPGSFNILTVNRHTGYLYNLSRIGHRWLVLGEWVSHNRPFPANFEPVEWNNARQNFAKVDVVIGHDIRRDLARLLPYCFCHHKSYIQVLHGRRARGGFSRSRLRKIAKNLYSGLVLGFLVKVGFIQLVFISNYAGSDWGLQGTVIKPGLALEEMGPYEGMEPTLLVVGNMLHREHFAFDELMQIRARVPVKIVGENPNIADARPSRDWDELRLFYRQCRAYLNLTREPEDGHNLAVLEAMASGMPVISLKHPSTPVRDGENGFLVESVPEAVKRAEQLIADLELARRLGKSARETIAREFSLDAFRERWNELLARCTGPVVRQDAP